MSESNKVSVKDTVKFLVQNPIFFEEEVPVLQSDFDQYGHVAATRYLDFVFTSRWIYTERKGFGMEALMEKGFIFPVLRTEVNYKREILKPGKVFVRSWVEEIIGARFWVSFQLFSEKSESAVLHSDGRFMCVCCDYKTRKPTKVPDWLLMHFENSNDSSPEFTKEN
jgi:YbgC/YbaW family acyl-CoA thioester hydrolase